MRVLQARITNGLLRVAIHMDESKMIPDLEAAVPAEGAEDTRPQVPDPAYVLVREWACCPEGVDEEEYVAGILAEMKLLAEDELARRARQAAGPAPAQVLSVEGAVLE